MNSKYIFTNQKIFKGTNIKYLVNVEVFRYGTVLYNSVTIKEEEERAIHFPEVIYSIGYIWHFFLNCT